MFDFPQLLDDSRIRCKQQISSKKRALESLSELLTPYAEEHSHMDILDALSARERLGSTGLGHGIALPHGRMAMLQEPVAAVITLEEGIDFESPDSLPVDIIVALLMPQHCNDEHLKILAGLAKLFIQEDLRQALREAIEPEQIITLLTDWPAPSDKEKNTVNTPPNR